MESSQLGATGLRVSRLCLGTMDFGSRLDDRQAVEVLDRAHELGVSFIDTANIYPHPPGPQTWGRSEEIIGRWLVGKRDDIVIATKCGGTIGAGPNACGGSRKHVIEACEASLRRLNVDAIDLLFLHMPSPTTPIEETLDALDHLVSSGKVRYFGTSNFEAWQLALAIRGVATTGCRPIAATSPSYSLVRRSPERDLLPLACAAGISVIPYYALAVGLLSGKFNRATGLPPDYRLFRTFVSAGPHRGIDPDRQVGAAFDVVDAVKSAADELGATCAQIALAWIQSKNGVASTIVGASRPSQLDDAAAAALLELPAETVERLDRVSFTFQ